MKLQVLLSEARKPGITYTIKETKKKVERVTAVLEGTESAAMSKLAKRYIRLEQSLKAAQEKRDELNERLKNEVSGLFEPEEAVLTRVVETVSFSLTMAKEIEKRVPESVKYDYEKIALELAKLIPAELQSKVDEITKMYSTITPASVKPGVKKLSVSPLEEGMLNTIKKIAAAISDMAKKFKRWATNFDSSLGNLQDRFNKIKAEAKTRKV